MTANSSYADRGSGIEGDTSVAGLLARAEALDYKALLETEAAQEWKKKYLDSNVEEAMKDVLERWGSAPPETEVRRAAIGAADPRLGIERFLLEWELAQGPPPPNAARIMGYARQGEPQPPPDEPAFIVLLPTAEPWVVYAYMAGLWNSPSDRLIRASPGMEPAIRRRVHGDSSRLFDPTAGPAPAGRHLGGVGAGAGALAAGF